MLEVPQDSDRVNNAQLFSLDALHTTGYYDDPKDTRRTMANMESSCLVYADRYFKSDIPVYANDNFVGIEIPFVLRVGKQKFVRDNPPYENLGTWILYNEAYY